MNQSQSTRVLQLSLSILSKWIVPRIKVSSNTQERYIKCTYYWVNKLEHWIANQGIVHTCKRVKAIRAIVIAYLAGKPVFIVKETIAINSKGLPRALGPLGALCDGDSNDRRYLLTLLSVSKALTSEPRPNLDPIETPFSGTIDPLWDKRIERYFKGKGVERGSLMTDFTEYHLSTKTSPSGNNALNDSLSEAKALRAFPELLFSIITIGGPLLEKNLMHIVEKIRDEVPTATTLRRVSAISDKEAKTRVVAVLDYWSQTSLLPLHNSLLKLLGKMRTDMTYDQGGFQNVLTSGPYYCFDLKDATDRFPIALQRKVISYLVGEVKAEAWSVILTRERYVLPGGGHIRYRCGQPMGAYSSWAAFTITHHIVVQAAAMSISKYPFSKYVILGDDIVIADAEVALVYKKLMIELGVEFSHTKSIVSENLYEFASRIFLNKEEISPFSMKGIFESSQHPASIVEFLRTMRSHGWDLLQDGNVPGQIRSLQRLLGFDPFKRWDDLITAFYYIPLKDIVKAKNSSLGEGFRLLDDISCFPNQHAPILRNALIMELKCSVETRIDELLKKHLEWSTTIPTPLRFIRFDPGDKPIAREAIPISGVWASLRQKAKDLARELLIYSTDPDSDHPLDKWMSDLTGLNNAPECKRVFKDRRHVQITLTMSSLILRAVKRLRVTGYTRHFNPHDEMW